MNNLNIIELPRDHNFDQKELNFLGTLDGGLSTLQKQINDIYVRMETSKAGGSKNTVSKHERELNRKWLVAYLKKQPLDAIQTELKLDSSFSPVHTTIEDDSSGAVLVPDLLASEINHYVIEGGIARREMRYMPFGGAGNTRKLPIETGGVQVQWVDEMHAKPITGLTLENVLQRLEKLAAIAVITENLLEDAAFDLVGYVARRIGEAIAVEEDRVFFAGLVLGGDPFNGVINAAGVMPVFLGMGSDADDVNADTLLNMTYRVPKHARTGGKFYMHSDILHRIQRLRIDVLVPGDGLGGYLVQPATASAPASIWGYPIVTVDQLPGADEIFPDSPFMFFGNLQKTCVYGDKNGIRVKILTEATLTDVFGNTVSLAQNDAVGVRVYKRVGYVPVLPEGIAVLIAGGDEGSGSN